MQTLRVGRGYTAIYTVQLRYAQDHPTLAGQPVVGVYSGSEPLSLAADDGLGGSVTLTGSTVGWGGKADDGVTDLSESAAAALGRNRLVIDDTDTSALGPGRYRLSISLTTGSEPIEVFRATLLIEDR